MQNCHEALLYDEFNLIVKFTMKHNLWKIVSIIMNYDRILLLAIIKKYSKGRISH